MTKSPYGLSGAERIPLGGMKESVDMKFVFHRYYSDIDFSLEQGSFVMSRFTVKKVSEGRLMKYAFI